MFELRGIDGREFWDNYFNIGMNESEKIMTQELTQAFYESDLKTLMKSIIKEYKHKKLFMFLHQYRGPILMLVPRACASYFIIMNGYSSLIDLFFLMSILGAFYWIFDVLKK